MIDVECAELVAGIKITSGLKYVVYKFLILQMRMNFDISNVPFFEHACSH